MNQQSDCMWRNDSYIRIEIESLIADLDFFATEMIQYKIAKELYNSGFYLAFRNI